MTLITKLTAGCAVALLAGCAPRMGTDTYCAITSPIYFGSDQTVDYLIGNDRQLLRDIIVHNETIEGFCT
jgi:hypothetical protein